MRKIRINRQFEIDVAKIYEIEQKRWGRVWIKYFDKKNQKKACKCWMDLNQITCNINELRLLENLSILIPKK